MKRIITIGYLCFLCFMSTTAQIPTGTITVTVPELRQRIHERDSVVALIPKKDKDVKIDSLNSQIQDYKVLTDILSTDLESANSTLGRLSLIMTEDESVFASENTFDANEYPRALSRQIGIINHYIEARKICEEIDRKIAEINSTGQPNKMTAIKGYILDDFVALDEKMDVIKELDLSTLSEKQVNFINESLKTRYNNYIPYINYETE